MEHDISGTFATRRDAEIAVEHLVQEHGIDRNRIVVRAQGESNSAGSRPAGADTESGHRDLHKDSAAELGGAVQVVVQCRKEQVARVKSILESSGPNSGGTDRQA